MKMKSMEDDMLYERRGTPALRSARSELVVPTPWTSWLWPGAPNSNLWPRACAATGNPVSMTGFSTPLSWVLVRVRERPRKTLHGHTSVHSDRGPHAWGPGACARLCFTAAADTSRSQGCRRGGKRTDTKSRAHSPSSMPYRSGFASKSTVYAKHAPGRRTRG